MSQEHFQLPAVLPLFPLPEVVLFPRAMIPLHIFEPRYQTMTADALAGEQLIAIALLKPGFEPLYYTRKAPIHRVVGVGQIVASEQLDDGNYNILVRGMARARVLDELSGRDYRLGRVESLEDERAVNEPELARLRSELRRVVQQTVITDPDTAGRWLELFDAQLQLGDLADLIASGLPVLAELRQALLAEACVANRTSLLLEHLRTLTLVNRKRRSIDTSSEWRLN